MDVPALTALMEAAIADLLRPFLTAEQVAASRALMGLDTQLIEDGTYFIVEQDGVLAGCGGWSRRATMYGGDASPGRDAAFWIRRGTPPGCGRCTRIPPLRAAASAA